MATRVTAAPARSSLKKPNLNEAPKSGRGKSRPLPLSNAAAPPLLIAASKPRNPIAWVALLKKSGVHQDKRRSQKLRALGQWQSGLDDL